MDLPITTRFGTRFTLDGSAVTAGKAFWEKSIHGFGLTSSYYENFKIQFMDLEVRHRTFAFIVGAKANSN